MKNRHALRGQFVEGGSHVTHPLACAARDRDRGASSLRRRIEQASEKHQFAPCPSDASRKHHPLLLRSPCVGPVCFPCFFLFCPARFSGLFCRLVLHARSLELEPQSFLAVCGVFVWCFVSSSPGQTAETKAPESPCCLSPLTQTSRTLFSMRTLVVVLLLALLLQVESRRR